MSDRPQEKRRKLYKTDHRQAGVSELPGVSTWSISTGGRGQAKVASSLPSTSGSDSNRSRLVPVDSKPPKAPRRMKACRNCREIKHRCISDETRTDAKCKRCESYKLDCVFEIKMPPQQQNTQVDVAARRDLDEWKSSVEGRIDGLSSTLESMIQLMKTQITGAPQSSPGYRGSPGSNVQQTLLQDMSALFAKVEDSASKVTMEIAENIPGHPSDEFKPGYLDMLNIAMSPPLHQHNVQTQSAGNVIPNGGGMYNDQMLSTINGNIGSSFSPVMNNTSPLAPNNCTSPREIFDQIEKTLASENAVPYDRSPNINSNACASADGAISNWTLSYDQASFLFTHFHRYVLPNFFGFHSLLSNLDISQLWNSSNALVIGISMVGCLFHPTLNILFETLKAQFLALVKDSLFARRSSPRETLDLVVALGVAGFWIEEQMIVSIALHLAAELDMRVPASLSFLTTLSDPATSRTLQKLLLWYILYAVDLLQSTNSGLQKNIKLSANSNTDEAISLILNNKVRDLISPAAVGLPWQTNLDLDKWIVQWTLKLPHSELDSWAPKVTLIHYNFAKMYINSKAEENEDKFLTNSISSSLAVHAAETLLTMATTDKDVISALKHVPMHTLLMVYFSSVLLLNSDLNNRSLQSQALIVRDSKKLVDILKLCTRSNDKLSYDIARELHVMVERKLNGLKRLGITDLSNIRRRQIKEIRGWPGSQVTPAR